MEPILNQNQHTILLIDNDYSKFIDGFSVIGKANGFNIRAFDTIENGFKYLKANEKEINAILLDLSFTTNNYEGLEALHQLKKNSPLLPVIMLSGSHEKDLAMAIACMNYGAFSYVVKTNFDLVSLFQMLKVAVNQYQSNIQLERYTTLKEEYRNKFVFYEKMLYTTEMIMNNIFKNKLMFPPTYEKRVKEFSSLYKKIMDKEKVEGYIADPFKRITDIAGLRIIFYNAVDLQKAVEFFQASDDFVDFKEGAHLIADDKSKTLGYRAVHFDVKLNAKKRLHLEEYQLLLDIPCEIQFKTIFAHSWSKVHHALSYKEIGEMKLTSEEQQRLDEDFIVAAKKLEDIEQQITSLCAKSYLNMKSIPNSN